MVGFGFMDQTVLLQAGNAIDCTIGVTFGFSTLTAAAFGSIVSMGVGVLFGGAVERVFNACGLPNPGFSAAQRSLPIVRRVGLAGNFFGVIFGCSLGMINLYFIDTEMSSTLKLQALSEEQEFAFEVEASNRLRRDATALTVRGPDIDGLLASMTSALTSQGCSLVELHASPRESSGSDGTVEDIFIVRQRGSKTQIDDDKLGELSRALLAATKDPLLAHSLKAQVTELEAENEKLISRVKKLEDVIEEKQVTIIRGDDTSSNEEFVQSTELHHAK
eukprot:CAMPEP_0185740836 /NCGR_PEP_ID=MMETSP1171-20130828/38637_1 /TAXON_ID=374046 /ORGANISM="Helicotheca tamensis, Strain CCMP826" /LENGTH=275 /DNA_ID=CAMNT_0028412765 /DNA_START=285 /DNA_END=1112 /DNA_ORIENTATION=+